MKTSTRVKVGTGVSLACDAIAIGAGTTALVFHIQELKGGKEYDVVKDGIRDLGSGLLIGGGVAGIVGTIKGYKTTLAVAEAADGLISAGSKIAKAAASDAADPE